MPKTKILTRCQWAHKDIHLEYHDTEWGVPVYDDQVHFEFLILESAQAGLSWDTILKKRENYRKAFANFDAKKVARFTEKKIEKLLLDPGIVRNRLKVNSAVNNAQKFLEVQKEFGTFSNYIWGFVNHKPIVNRWQSMAQVPATSPESDALSKDLKKHGFKFVGSTIVYAHMQATGLINDHTIDCFRFQEIEQGYEQHNQG